MKTKFKIALAVVIIAGLAGIYTFGQSRKTYQDRTLQVYLDYFQSIYDIMKKEYYLDVPDQFYQDYILYFKSKIYYPQVKDKAKVDEGIKHTGAGLMVSKLKDMSDPFTNFFPPQMVKEFKESVLGFASDIGLEGEIKDGRFIIIRVELNSDSAKKGISANDQVLKVEGREVSALTQEEVMKLFAPPEGKTVALEVFFPRVNQTSVINVVSAQYFKQSVFSVPTSNPAIACLKIKFFNQDTGNQMRSFIDQLGKDKISKLIIDLRDNSGGPPLAAWDISGIFLETEERLFYFQKKGQPASGLVVSASPVKFTGDVVILINKGTGSASELFAGFMQAYRRAGLVGENTAGKVYLKSLFDLSDGATLELTVAKGYLFTGEPIANDGLKPNVAMADNAGLLDSAVSFMEAIGKAAK